MYPTNKAALLRARLPRTYIRHPTQSYLVAQPRAANDEVSFNCNDIRTVVQFRVILRPHTFKSVSRRFAFESTAQFFDKHGLLKF